MAFWVGVAGVRGGECCLMSAFKLNTVYNLNNGEFYSMSQCTVCREGYFKRGRRCLPLSILPAVDGGYAGRTLRIPLNTAPGTVLATFRATAASGAGTAQVSLLAAGGSVPLPPLDFDQVTGALTLREALTAPGSLRAVIEVRDEAEECTLINSDGIPETRPGACIVRIDVIVQTVVFLNCPGNINRYLSPSESSASIPWTEPSLPAFLSDLSYTRDLEDTSSTASPFIYPVGNRRVTYTTTEPLTIGGELVCAFDVTVQYGLRLDITSIGRKEAPSVIREFLVVDPSITSEGARLPSFEGTVEGRRFAVGLFAPPGKPFTVSPNVRISVLFLAYGYIGALAIYFSCNNCRFSLVFHRRSRSCWRILHSVPFVPPCTPV